MSPPVPSIAGHELLGELGRGGMGTVYRARHVATGAERALKVLSGAYGTNEVERFRRETEALVRVGGPGIVTVHDAGSERGRPYIVMALLPGGSLRDRLRRTSRWPWRDAVALVRDLAVALERCHAAGIVHRDVKPENVLFDEEGRAFLTDFGCVRDLGARSLTETGAIVGTPDYMAPEQLDGRKVDARADVYSLGALLHELVSGEAPYAGANVVAMLVKKTTLPPPPLRVAGVPDALGVAVARALAPAPGERFESAGALAVALAAVAAEDTAAPANASAKATRGRRPRLALVTVASLLAAAALAGHGRPVPTRADGDAPVATATVSSASRTSDPSRPRASGTNDAAVANALRLLRGNAALAEAKDVFQKAALAADREGAAALRAAALDRISLEAAAADRTTDWRRLSTSFENGERAYFLARDLGLAGPPPSLVEIVEKLVVFVKANVGYEETTRRAIELVVHLKPEVFVPALIALLTTLGGRAVDNDVIVGTVEAALAAADGRLAEPDPSNLRHLRTVHAFFAWKERKTPAHAKQLAAAIDDFLSKGDRPSIIWATAWGHLTRAILLEWEKEPAAAFVEWEIAARTGGEAFRENASERIAFERLHARLLLALDRDFEQALLSLEEVRPLLAPPERETLGVVIGELRAGPTPERRRELIVALGGPP